MAEKAARPARAVNYERSAPAPQKRATPAELFAKLPVKEVVVLEPEEVKAEAYERIGEERTFEVEITPPQRPKREIVRPKYTVKGQIDPKRTCSRPRRRARCRGGGGYRLGRAARLGGDRQIPRPRTVYRQLR